MEVPFKFKPHAHKLRSLRTALLIFYFITLGNIFCLSIITLLLLLIGCKAKEELFYAENYSFE